MRSDKFAYVANSQDSNVTAYSISNGALTSHLGTLLHGRSAGCDRHRSIE